MEITDVFAAPCEASIATLRPKSNSIRPHTHMCVCGTYRLILEATDDFAAPGKASFATISPKSILISPHLLLCGMHMPMAIKLARIEPATFG